MAMGMGTVNNWAAGGATTLLGLNQYYKGKKMLKNNKRPTYEIPAEVQANLNQAEQMALQGMPEEQKQQYINNLQRSQAFSMSQMGSRKAGLAGVAAVNQQGVDAYGNLLSMDAQARMQNQGVLMNQRQNMADYRDQAFQINKLNPYYEKQSEGLAMQGAGMQNVGNSFQIAGGGSGQNVNPDKGKSSQMDFSQGVQMMQNDGNRNGNNYYNPYKPQSGTMVPDGQYGNYPNSMMG